MVDMGLIKKLIHMVKDENISGLVVEEGGVKYEIRKEFGGVAPTVSPVEPQIPAQQAGSPTHKDEPKKVKKKEDEEDANLVAITSPMVGTFYRSPSPDSPPFADIGDQVSVGKVICIVEAMKLFNEIESEVSGKIEKILVENGKPVEYGQKLMLVRKA